MRSYAFENSSERTVSSRSLPAAYMIRSSLVKTPEHRLVVLGQNATQKVEKEGDILLHSLRELRVRDWHEAPFCMLATRIVRVVLR